MFVDYSRTLVLLSLPFAVPSTEGDGKIR